MSRLLVWTVENAQALVHGRSNPLWTMSVAWSSAFEDNGTQLGPRRSMPIAVVNSTDEDPIKFLRLSSAVDDAAIGRVHPLFILECNTSTKVETHRRTKTTSCFLELALEQIHAGQTAARRLSLRRDLSSLTKSFAESMITCIMRAKHICTSLRAIDGTVTDTQLIDSILAGLPNEYENKVEMLATMGETDMIKIQNQLLQAESALSAKKTNEGKLAVVTQMPKLQVNCSYYGRKGHTREKCWYLNGLPRHLQKKSNNETENDKKFAFVTSTYKYGTFVPLENVWIVDNGATTHVCSNRYWFQNDMKQIGQQEILVGNGDIVTAQELGDVTMQPDLELHDILSCPELRANLISVNKLIVDGYNVYFANNECSIWKGKTKKSLFQKSIGF